MGRIEVWARPGSRQDGIEWDEWRKRWVVSCRERPKGGMANEAILRILSDRLSIRGTAIRLVTSARTRAKVVEVTGLSDSEIAERLHRSHSADS